MSIILEQEFVAKTDNKFDKLVSDLIKLHENPIEVKTDNNASKEAKQNKVIAQRIDLAKQYMTLMSEGRKESAKMAEDLYHSTIANNRVLTAEEKKRLEFQKEKEKIENNRAKKIEQQAKNESTAIKKQEVAIAKDRYKLEKLIFDLKYQGLDSSAKEAENLLNTLNTQKAITEEQKHQLDMSIKKEKVNVKKATGAGLKKEIDMTEKLEQLKNKIISNNLSIRYKKKIDMVMKENNFTLERFNKLQNAINRKIAENQADKADMASSFGNYMVFQQLASKITESISESAKFEDSLYQMGIIAGKTNLEITGLRDNMYDLGSSIPRATQEIVEQIAEIERTGRSYEESLSIMRDSSKLAVASGESLQDSVKITNTVLKAFDIQVLNSEKALDALHTATMKTPLDLEKVSSAMKNAGASMRNFIESSTKTGDALESYKQDVLNLTLALTGGQVAMGRTANSAGVSVRMLGVKLINLEKTAKSMFDTQMKLNGVFEGADGITSDYLSTLAQEDLPKAVELLSKLYTEGKLSIGTLTKMFTSRHAPYLISQLQLINGNIGEYVDSMTKGSKVSNDYEKGLKSFSNQLNLLKNNYKSLNIFTSRFADIIGVDVIKGVNHAIESMRSLSDDTSRLGLAFGGASDAVMTLSMALTALSISKFGISRLVKGYQELSKFKLIDAMGGMKALNYLTLVSGALIFMYSIHKRITLQKELELELNDKLITKTKEQIKANDQLYNLVKIQKNMIENISNKDMIKEWNDAYDIIAQVTDKSKDLQTILTASKKIEAFKFPELKTTANIQKEVIENTKIEIELIKEKALEGDKAYKKKIDQNNRELKISQAKMKQLYTETEYYIDSESKLDMFIKKYRLLEREKLGQGKAENLAKEQIGAITAEYNYERKLFEDLQEEKARLNKKFNEKLIKENLDFAKKKAMVELSSQKITEKAIEDARINIGKTYNEMEEIKHIPVHIDYSSAMNNDFKVVEEFFKNNKGKTLFDALDLASTREMKSLYSALTPEIREMLGLTEYINATLEAKEENLSKVNKKAEELLTYYEQIQSVASKMEYETFAEIAKKAEVKGIGQYSQLAEQMGFSKIKEGIDLLSNGMDDVFDKLSKADMSKLVDEGNLLGAIGKVQTIEKAISSLKKSTEKDDVTKAMDRLKNESYDLYEVINKGYDGVKRNSKEYSEYMIAKLKEILNYQLEALTMVSPSAIKSSFYVEEETTNRLNLLKIQKEGFEQLLIEQKQLEDSNKKQEEIYKNRLSEIERLKGEQKSLADLSIGKLKEEKKALIERRNLQQADPTVSDKIKQADVDKAKYLDELIQLRIDRENQLNDEKIKSINLDNNIIKDIDSMISKSNELIANYSKINKSQAKYSDLVNAVKGKTEESVNWSIKQTLSQMQNNNTIMSTIKNKKTLTEKDSILLNYMKEQQILSENKLKTLKEELGILNKINSENKKIEEINTKTNEWIDKKNSLNDDSYKSAIYEKNVIDKNLVKLKEKIDLTNDDKEIAEIKEKIAKTEYDQQIATNKVLEERNNIIKEGITGIGNVISALTGADSQISKNFSVIENISGLLGKGGAISQIKSGTSQMMKGDGLKESALGALSMMGGYGQAIGAGMQIADVVLDSSEKSTAKAEARFKKQYDLSVEQLNALKSMSSGLKSYSDRIIEALVKIPTFSEYKKQISKVKPTSEALASGGFKLSDVTYTRRTGADWKGKTGKKTSTVDVEDFIGKLTDNKISSLDMSIDDMKFLKSEMEKVDNWNEWYTKNMGSARSVVDTNIDIIEAQLGEYIYAYEKMNDVQENLMREATIGSFKSAEYVNILETRKQYEELGAKLFEGFENKSQMIQDFVEVQMDGIEDITSSAGISIRNSLIDGISQGLDETEILTNAFTDIFKNMSHDINSVITDIMFDSTYENIKELTTQATNDLINMKESILKSGNADTMNRDIDNMMKSYVNGMKDVIYETQKLDDITVSLNQNMREAMLKDERFDKEFIDKLFPPTAFKPLEQSVNDAFMNALKTENYSKALDSLGEFMGNSLIDSMLKETLGEKHRSLITGLSSKMSDVMADGFSVGATQSLRSEISHAMMQMDQAQSQALMLKDMFSFGMGDVEYEEVNKDVKYETGSTQTINNYYNNSYAISLGNLIASDQSMHEFALRFKEYINNV